MTNLEKYVSAFISSFSVEESSIPELEYQSIPEWDSVGHMALMAALEEAFEITLDIDDVIEFGSFIKGKDILKKYDIDS